MGTILKALGEVLAFALSFLPDSPFQGFLDGLEKVPYLAYLNWFIPIGDFLKILGVWCAAIGIFYIVSVILRFVKAIN